MNFDPEIIMAYVDGELDLVTARRIEKAMDSDRALAQRIAAERALKVKLAARFDPIEQETVPDRLSALLTNVDTSLTVRRDARQRWFGFGIAQWGAVAASLALGLVLGHANLAEFGGHVVDRDGILIAESGLKTALDGQLASNQPADAATKIGLTFRDKQGAICRTFEGETLLGIACRNGSEWQLRQILSGAVERGDYRQAASSELAEAASKMMAGGALDARGEREVLMRDWK